MVKVVPLGVPEHPILMLSGALLKSNTVDFVWIVGANRFQLEYEIKMEIFECSMLHRYLYAYKVRRRDFEQYTKEHGFPVLVCSLGSG